jgi:hypothetical protein
MKYKFIDITEIKGPIDWPEPRNLTPEEEAELIAQYKAQIDPVQLEAECRQLLEQYERGELVDADELLRDIEAGTPPRKPS